MTGRILYERLKDWEVYDKEGNVKTVNLLDAQIEIPGENSTGIKDRTISITVGYDADRNIVILAPSGKDGRLE